MKKPKMTGKTIQIKSIYARRQKAHDELLACDVELDKIIKQLPTQDIHILQLEPHNFRVSSKGWKKITVDGKKYLENKTKDIWELADGPCKGEQLFTWLAAMRETKKAGKRMPTDEEFSELLKTKADYPNPVYPGHRGTDGSFYDLTSYENSWSSSFSGGSAWNRALYSGGTAVRRDTGSQAYGFSCRCLR